MAEKVDCNLGLSLSLICPGNQIPPPTLFPLKQHKISTTIDRNSEARSSFLGVNRCDVDGAEVMFTFSNSTVSSVSGKRRENDGEKALSSLQMDVDGGDSARKKLRLTKEQAVVLEETFKEHSTMNPKQNMGLAKYLNLRPRQVEVWFQKDKVEADRGRLRVLEAMLQ